MRNAYDDEGDGPPLLLVHGHPFDRSMWRPQFEHFRSRYRVVVPDLRGYGDAPAATGTTPLSAFAADLVALLDDLGIDRAVVCGLSMGGQITMELHRSHPERVRALVLADTTPEPDDPAAARARHEAADRVEREGIGPYADELMRRMISPRTVAERPDVADHVRRMMHGAPPSGAAAALRGRAARPDYAPSLAAARVPALVVVGEEDEYTPVATARRLHETLPGSAFAVVPGAGHLPNLERPALFDEVVGRFLDELPDR
ncbi:alpha/beta fold hydrolase [Saccharothrix sp. Mg75]|uniref:alpha/beta fold hydrolase n=1 Tax=Saccharothrix sp. Mg75 TaxID=3445357 RepID=UPI003EEA0768